MNKHSVKLLENMRRQPRVAVLGDIMLDRFIWGGVSRISPEAPVPILEMKREENRLGGAANVANNLAALGAKASCFGSIGSDHHGSTVIKMMRKAGINTTGTVLDPSKPTIVKTRMIAHAQQVLRVDEEKPSPFPARVEKKIIARLRKALKTIDIVILSDYNKGMMTKSLAGRIIRLAKASGKRIVIDPKGRDYSKYKGATALTPNLNELSLASGMEVSDPSSLRKAALKLVRELELEFIVITQGADGMSLFSKDGSSFHVPALARAVYDVTGAGDTVIAALGFALAGGSTLQQAVKIANFAAGIVVGKLGTATVTIDELKKYLSDGATGVSFKIMKPDQLRDTLESRKNKGETVVFTNGCFDILHLGHVKNLQFAKSQGDILVVGMNSDRSVSSIKGPGRPIVPLPQREEVMASLEMVDYVTVFDEPTPEKLIKTLKPDVLVKGSDWKEKKVVGAAFVKSRGGKVVFAPTVKGLSTTELIRRLSEVRN